MSTSNEQEVNDAILSAEQLGLTVNQYLDHPRWARILLNEFTDDIWVPTGNPDASGHRTVTSGHEDFDRWQSVRRFGQTYLHEGYIGGFPQITDTETDEVVECLHMWDNNADTEPGQKAFPVHAIRAALLTTRRESGLRIHADNLTIEGTLSSRYRVPVLLDTTGGQLISTISKAASAKDILDAVTTLQDPLYYFGPPLIPDELKEKEGGKVFGFVGLDGQRRGNQPIRDLPPQDVQELLELS